jgi:hypothetical protein
MGQIQYARGKHRIIHHAVVSARVQDMMAPIRSNNSWPTANQTHPANQTHKTNARPRWDVIGKCLPSELRGDDLDAHIFRLVVPQQPFRALERPPLRKSAQTIARRTQRNDRYYSPIDAGVVSMRLRGDRLRSPWFLTSRQSRIRQILRSRWRGWARGHAPQTFSRHFREVRFNTSVTYGIFLKCHFRQILRFTFCRPSRKPHTDRML